MTTLTPQLEITYASGAFPQLGSEHLDTLRRYGRQLRVGAGQVLIREGERERDFLAVIAGTVAVYEGYGTPEQRLVRMHVPGDFLDELGLLTGQPALTSAMVAEPAEVLAVPLPGLRKALSRHPELGDSLLRAFIIRRELLIGQLTGIRVIGSRFSPDSRRVREFAARNRLPHTFIDLERDQQAEELLRQLGIRPQDTPVVIVRGTTVLRDPTNAQLALALGLPPPTREDSSARVHDLLIVGAGPAGLGAAVYGASEGLATVVIDAVATGGQAGTSARIENYLGFPAGISGAELADRAVVQAGRFGATISVPAQAVALTPHGGYHTVRVDDGTHLRGRVVVIATGARYRKLELPQLEEFEGTSVHYAATLVEARLCRQQEVAVVGGGNSAGQATIYLSQYARRVHLLVRHHDLGRDMSRYLVEEIRVNPYVDVHRDTEVRELVGHDGDLQQVVAENRSGHRSHLPATQLFVFIGAEPCTGWLRGSVDLDEDGYVLTGHQLREGVGGVRSDATYRESLETSLPGVLAVGDVRSGSVKRIASAVGEGAMAVRLAHDRMATTTGRVPGGEPAG